jgi:purine-nucleoside phosphorylase
MMSELYRKLKEKMRRYSGASDLMQALYGLDESFEYDLVIVAPSWKPEKIFSQIDCIIEHVKEGPYYNGYMLTIKDKKIAYIQTAAGASNVLDCCLTLGHGTCKQVVFIGAVGALKEDITLGDLIIPICSIAGDGASLYLDDQISTKNFLSYNYPDKALTHQIMQIGEAKQIPIARKVVYSTDSIYCEYSHLEEILEKGAEAIEMETAVFFRAMNLMEFQGTALLCVSDNSAVNQHLVGRSVEDTIRFHASRGTMVAELICGLLEQ